MPLWVARRSPPIWQKGRRAETYAHRNSSRRQRWTVPTFDLQQRWLCQHGPPALWWSFNHLFKRSFAESWLRAGASAAVAVAFFFIVSLRIPARAQSSAPQEPRVVGSATCSTCHLREGSLWQRSHHQLAMQEATERSVLGSFTNSRFTNGSVTSIFFRKESKFMVRTEGADGALHDYEIKFTFGVYPLQQYLIQMSGGRLQALGIAWDCRPVRLGGQRWFFLYPGQKITNKDPLHWTGIDQNWNYMCADCHSTNVRKNYNAVKRTFSTRYSELDVACEACHGPGSNHVAWARRQGDWRSFDSSKGLLIALDERQGVKWSVSPGSGEVIRSAPRHSEREIEMCARCHSRRTQIHEDYVHGQEVGDDYRVALLDPDLYFPDGQVKAEDYEYGSFIQSRMYHAGVTCSDCHEPHSLRLRASGNGVCLECHSGERYDSRKHHFHKANSSGAQCINCHMPSRTYMVVDSRRDHSLRVPRPDLSSRLGVPNACTSCHVGKTNHWASAAIEKWYGHRPLGFQRFAEALDGGTEQRPSADQMLTNLILNDQQPAIARASALSLLKTYAPSGDDQVIRTSITGSSALTRRAVALALSNSTPNSAITAAPLLSDPVRAVRLEAAEVLAGTPRVIITSSAASALARAIKEYIASQELAADRPEAHMNLGLLYEQMNHPDKAEDEFNIALSLDPMFGPAAVDLADLYRAEGSDLKSETVLTNALKRMPENPSLQHALGLAMVRRKKYGKGVALLASAAREDSGNARYGYVYAIALNDAGHPGLAIAQLKRVVKANPYDRNSLASLVSLLGQSQQPGQCLIYAERLLELEPDNSELRQLVAQLHQQSAH